MRVEIKYFLQHLCLCISDSFYFTKCIYQIFSACGISTLIRVKYFYHPWILCTLCFLAVEMAPPAGLHCTHQLSVVFWRNQTSFKESRFCSPASISSFKVS